MASRRRRNRTSTRHNGSKWLTPNSIGFRAALIEASSFLREAEGVGFARERVEPGSVLSADEVAHWDLLASSFDLKRVNQGL